MTVVGVPARPTPASQGTGQEAAEPSSVPDSPRQCTALTIEGERCPQRAAVGESGFCLFHDPARKAEAAEARERGRTNRGRLVKTVAPEDAPPAPKTIDDIANYGSWATDAVTTGKIDARTAREIANLLTVLHRVIDKQDLLLRIKELEDVRRRYEKEREEKVPR